jgi:uncharacterized integral membrane protein
MSRFAWILTLPLMVVIVLFAVSNRENVLIDLFPLPSSLTAPLFAVVLMTLVVGIAIGALIEGARGWKTRRALKDANRRADALAESLAALKAKEPPKLPAVPAAEVPSAHSASAPKPLA